MKENGKSPFFFTLFILVPGNCFVDGYDVEDLIKFFLPPSRISSLKIKEERNKKKEMELIKKKSVRNQ
jgi:hypothetical protein